MLSLRCIQERNRRQQKAAVENVVRGGLMRTAMEVRVDKFGDMQVRHRGVWFNVKVTRARNQKDD